MNCKTLFVGIVLAVPMLITGCAGKRKVIGIEITTPPPASMEVNQTATIAATVTNDHSSMGVDWSCTPLGTCGTFTPVHTASGATTVYTAPRTAGPVVITAASTKDPSKTAPADVNITAVAVATDLTGTYTFFVNGRDAEFATPFGVAGSIAINGATGKITTGEQDYFDSGTGDVFPHDSITGGTISVGSDGRGTLTLTPTAAPSPETFSITVVNDKHILITEFDSFATASGSLDLQTAPGTVPTGGNAFAILDAANGNALGGVLTSNGAITTASEADDDIGGSTDFDLVNIMTGSFTAPNGNGRGTFTLNDPNLTLAGFAGSIELAYYVVGPETFRLIEDDGNVTFEFAVGSMYGQGAAAFSGTSLGSKFVFGQSGIENTALGIGVYAAAGQFTGNGTTTLSAGVADVNEGDGLPVKAGAMTGSTYFVKANGYGGIAIASPLINTDGLANFGVYLIDPAINVADPNSASGGGGAVMLDLDTDNIGVGIVVPQATGPTFTGNYAFSQDGFYQRATASYYGLLGEITSDGTSKFAGLADYNNLNFAQSPGVTVSGTYTADAGNSGRSTSTLTVNGAATANNITIYQASSALLLHVDVDSSGAGLGTIGLGVLEKQQ